MKQAFGFLPSKGTIKALREPAPKCDCYSWSTGIKCARRASYIAMDGTFYFCATHAKEPPTPYLKSIKLRPGLKRLHPTSKGV